MRQCVAAGRPGILLSCLPGILALLLRNSCTKLTPSSTCFAYYAGAQHHYHAADNIKGSVPSLHLRQPTPRPTAAGRCAAMASAPGGLIRAVKVCRDSGLTTRENALSVCIPSTFLLTAVADTFRLCLAPHTPSHTTTGSLGHHKRTFQCSCRQLVPPMPHPVLHSRPPQPVQ